jgi:hypothetical protein
MKMNKQKGIEIFDNKYYNITGTAKYLYILSKFGSWVKIYPCDKDFNLSTKWENKWNDLNTYIEAFTQNFIDVNSNTRCFR